MRTRSPLKYWLYRAPSAPYCQLIMDPRIQVVVPSLTIITMALLLASNPGGWLEIVYILVLVAAVVWINVLHFRLGRSTGAPSEVDQNKAGTRRAV